MDANAKAELDSIKRELSAIIRELESISHGVRYDFKGIGNESCASCIDKVVNSYYSVRRKLDNMDTSTVTDEFKQAQE